MSSRRILAIPLVLVSCVLAWAQATRTVAILDVPGQPGFDGVAVVKGMLLMSHVGAGTVDIFDPAKRKVVGHVKNMSNPRGIAVDEDGGQVFIANSGAKNIVVLSAQDWQVKDTIPVSGTPTDLEYIPALGMLVATDPVAQKLMAVDVRGHREAAASELQGTPGGLAFDKSRGLLFVTLQDARQVVGLDRQMQVTRRYQLAASQPTGIVYDSKLNRLYVAVRYAVLSLDAETGKELSRVPADGGIDRLWLDRDSGMLLGAAGRSLLVMRADQRLHAVDEIPTDVRGYSVAYDQEHKLVFFPGSREGRSKLLLLKPPTANGGTDQNAEAKLR